MNAQPNHWRDLMTPGVIAAAAVLVLMLAIVAVALVRLTQPPDPPLAYTQDVYQAERDVYAPGETLRYTATLTVQRSGGLRLIRGWRTLPAHARARLCDGTNAPVIEDTSPPFPPEAVGTNVEGRISVTVPPLPPGRYVLISTAYKQDGAESITQVPIEVRQECPAG